MTIEERAKAYAYRNGTDFLSGFEKAEYTAYIAGAKEQKRIITNKALEAYCKVCDVKECEDWGGEESMCSWYNVFQEAMKK